MFHIAILDHTQVAQAKTTMRIMDAWE